jgi:hypothetical protein
LNKKDNILKKETETTSCSGQKRSRALIKRTHHRQQKKNCGGVREDG